MSDNTACNGNLGSCKTGTCSTPIFTRYGHYVFPAGISNDGTIVIGDASGATVALQMFRWTRPGGFAGLPGYNGATDCNVTAISGSGSYEVGYCSSGSVPVRWPGTSAPTLLGGVGGFTLNIPNCVNLDGSVASGVVIGSGQYPGLWRVGSPASYLMNLPANTSHGTGSSVSNDGSVIVGTVDDDVTTNRHAFIWTQASGQVKLIPYVSGDANASGAYVSGDGTKVIGNAQYGVYYYKTTTGTSTRLLYPGDGDAIADAISNDGTTIGAHGPSGVWLMVNEGTPKLLASTLAGLGVDLGGFILDSIDGMSANGKVIIGSGSIVAGPADEGWIVVLP
jgi:hypothetical protein